VHKVLDRLLSHYATVVLVPPWPRIPSFWVEPLDLHGILGLTVVNKLLDPRARALKRGLDIVVTVVTAPVWGPLVGILALAVWAADRQPPFYGQPRIGRHGAVFVPWKLRTMVPDADQRLAEQLRADIALRTEWENGFKLRDDPRLTRLGRWLRRWSLDELPQLWNVLKGEMSLVGPRPLPAYHQAQMDADARRLREQVLPGITGLWQVSGRSDCGPEEMARWDIYYVRNWSLSLDLVILAKTLRAVLSGRGAY